MMRCLVIILAVIMFAVIIRATRSPALQAHDDWCQRHYDEHVNELRWRGLL